MKKGFLLSALLAMLLPASAGAVREAETETPTGATVTGRVLDSGGEPVAGARVTVYRRVLGDGRAGRTDGEGFFSIAGIAPGRYNIEAAAAGFCREYVTRVAVGADGVSREITVFRPGSVSGRVTDRDGKPLAGIRVNRAVSDRNGFYRLDWERPGHLSLSARGEYFVRASARAEIEEGGHTRGVDFTLRPAGSVSGRAVDSESGEPLAGVEVNLHGQMYSRARSDANGEFRIDGLAEGSYSAGFYLQGYQYRSLEDIRVRPRETSRLPLARLEMRPEYFHLYDRNWVFLPGEDVYLVYNSFRVRRGTVSVYRLEPGDWVPGPGRASRARGRRFRDLARDASPGNPGAGPEPVLEREFEIEYPSPLSEIYNRRVDLGRLAPGVYTAVVSAGEAGESRVALLVTELGMVTRRGSEGTLFYLCRLDDGRPVSGAGITLYDGRFNIVGSGESDADGLFETALGHERALAVSGDSFAWLGSPGRPDGPDRESAARTYLYTERPVYRPGQVVYFKGVMRRETPAGYALPEEAGVEARVLDPRRDTVHRATLPVSENGTFDGSFSLPEEPALGFYRLEAGGGSAGFRVEEYRKPDFLVRVEPERAVYFPGETVRAGVSALYYFGAPVAGAEISYAVYRGGTRGVQVAAGEIVADERGEARLEIPLADTFEREEIHTIEARAVDRSRREVRGSGRFTAAPGAFRIDLSTDGYIFSPGDEIPVSARLSDYENNPAAGQAVRVSAAWRRWEGNRLVREEFWFRELVAGADGLLRDGFVPAESGYLEIRVEGDDARGNRVRATRGAWVAGRGRRVSRPGARQLEIILDRDRYEPGDTVRALVHTARPDMPLLVTLEHSGVIRRELVRPEGHGAFFEFEAIPEHAPTVYLSVNAVGGKQFFQATREISVSPADRLLEITVESDRERFEPGETVVYRLAARDRSGTPAEAELSFGLVDEAIYAVAPETTPRIEDFFYGRRPHLVASAYSFSEWLHAGAAKSGAAEDVRRDFQDTAWWSPRVLTGPSGTAELAVTLPDNLTTWRATVRGATRETLVGGATHRVVAAKPVSARLILPRFLVEGDSLVVSGIIHNETAEEALLDVSISARGLEIIDYGETTLRLAPGRQGRVDWQARAAGPGEALVTLRADSAAGRDAMELAIPVLVHGQAHSDSRAGEVDTTVTEHFDIPAGAIPGTVSLETYLYPSLASGFFRNLHYLAHYPYGCVEQTMSRFLPLVHVAGAFEALGTEALAFLAEDRPAFEKMLGEMPAMVGQGLSRLYSFQNRDGGWGWWSADASRPYTSAYVYYGLNRARLAGYEVDPGRLENARSFLAGAIERVACPDEKAYLLFALSRGEGAVPEGEVAAAMESRAEINDYSLALLALVQADRDREAAGLLLGELYAKLVDTGSAMSGWRVEGPGRYGWSHSDIEATAWALRATLAIDPGRPEIGRIVRYLLWRERAGRWRSTKDTAVCVMALAELLAARDELSPDYAVTLSVDGRPVSETRVDRETLRDFSVRSETPAELLVPGERHGVRLEKVGSGALYYTHDLNFTERKDFLGALDKGFSVSREYFRVVHEIDGHGVFTSSLEPLSGPLAVGDLVLVRLTVSGREGYEYFMLEDPLPAGCEVVEEPRERQDWTRREVRDRMVSFFATDFGSPERVFEYHARAETPGEFRVLPARASMMYLPEAWGQSAENRLVISDREE